VSGYDGNFGEHDARDALEQQLDVEREHADLDEWVREQRVDVLRRDDPAAAWCALCGERRGVLVYGGHCKACFEARREERDAA